MDVIDFSDDYLNSLIAEAELSSRLRQHRNVHRSHYDKCQRLMNAICIGSYIRPHRHHLDPKNEFLVAVKGLFAAIIFNHYGDVLEIKIFGTEKYGDMSVGIELGEETWHTIIALQERSVLLEVKAGPFDQDQAKEFAPWAPTEGSADAHDYFCQLRDLCNRRLRELHLLIET